MLGRKSGKNLIKNFLDYEAKNLSKCNNVSDVIRNVNSKYSNIYLFAELLKNKDNRNSFSEAVECQANSFGTLKSGLFYNLIYQGGKLDMEKLNCSKIK